PVLCAFVLSGFAVDTLGQAGRAESTQTVVDTTSESAEIVVTRVAEGQDRIPCSGQFGCTVRLESPPERPAVVGRVAVAEGARDDHEVVDPGQCGDVEFVQPRQFHGSPGVAEPLRATR